MAKIKVSGVPFRTDLTKAKAIKICGEIEKANQTAAVQFKALHKHVQNHELHAARELTNKIFTDDDVKLAATFEAARRGPTKRRPRLESLIPIASSVQPFEKPEQDVWVSPKAKSDGTARPVCKFPIGMKAAQEIVRRVMSPHLKPRSFQYTTKGVRAAIPAVIAFIEDGYVFPAKLDVKDFFASFDHETLADELPLPKEVVWYVVLGRHMQITVQTPKGTHYPTHHYLYRAARRGLPQGSICSQVISDVWVSRLDWQPQSDVVLVNYADDFLLLARNEADLKKEAGRLQEAVSALPGGKFSLKLKSPVPKDETLGNTAFLSLEEQAATFLGHRLSLEVGTVKVEVSAQSEGKFYKTLNEITAPIVSPGPMIGKPLDKDLVIEVLAQLLSYVTNWKDAFATCEDVDEYVHHALTVLRDFLVIHGVTFDEIAHEVQNGVVYYPDEYDFG